MASKTRRRVGSLTWGLLLITRETVPNPTPATLATSRMVAGMPAILGGLLEPVPKGSSMVLR